VNRSEVSGSGDARRSPPLDLVALVAWLAPLPVPNGSDLGPCWASSKVGYRTSDGYASAKVSARAPSIRAHRALWQALHGPLPPGLVLHHREDEGCLGRWCIRPGHLQPLTRSAHAVLHHRLRAAARAAA